MLTHSGTSLASHLAMVVAPGSLRRVGRFHPRREMAVHRRGLPRPADAVCRRHPPFAGTVRGREGDDVLPHRAGRARRRSNACSPRWAGVRTTPTTPYIRTKKSEVLAKLPDPVRADIGRPRPGADHDLSRTCGGWPPSTGGTCSCCACSATTWRS